MISKQEALNKACEMIQGKVYETEIKEMYMFSSRKSSLFYRVSIYHGDEDGNIFHDVVHILTNGTVAQWDRRHLKDEM